ncbi:MAG: ISNCY family transposase [Armatimonadota bacterium]
MNKKQQRRAEVLARVASGGISKADAERLLGLKRRQVDRLIRAYIEKGLASVVHGNSGRAPANKTPDALRRMLVELAGKDGKYSGLNTCHFHDLLIENEEICISRPTLYRTLREAGIIKPGRSKPKERRTRRERCPREGMMLQIDGSFHDWLSGRGPKMTLLGAIDDATGKIVHLIFRPTEDQAGYLMMLRSIAASHGLPECLYHDRHTILRSPKEATIEDELSDRVPMSQLQRVMSELGIVSIPALSPQAKGRIERLWKTLQDRLLAEMRIAGISSLSAANEFLPGFIARYNKRFAKVPVDAESAWVEIEPGMDMHYHFATSELRTVRRDHTISYEGKTLQILLDEKHHVLAGKRVDVRTSPEGEIKVYVGKEPLKIKELEARPAVASKEKKQPAGKPSDPKAKSRRRGWLYARPAA